MKTLLLQMPKLALFVTDVLASGKTTVKRHITEPIPILQQVRKKPTRRRKHVCQWTDEEVWGAVIFALLVGLLIGLCL